MIWPMFHFFLKSLIGNVWSFSSDRSLSCDSDHFWCQIWPVLCQNGSKWPLLDVKMAVFNYHLANPIYDQLIITVRAMIQQLSSGLPGHMVYCEPWRILRTDVYNMLWLKIIIYDYDMIILGITWKKYKSLILRLRVTV